jgi:hypothetical protein
VALDVSPKNLAWDDGWVLLDAGPKLKLGDAVRLASGASFADYVESYRAKLAAGPSAPSVVSAPASADELLEVPRRFALVRHLWRWFPLDPSPADMLVCVDPLAESDEVMCERGADGEVLRCECPAAVHEVASPAVRLAALAPSPIGHLYRAVAPDAHEPIPSLLVRPYPHWRDLLDPKSSHEPLDLYSHALFATEPPRAAPLAATFATPAGTFARLGLRHVPGETRAYVLVPGFRAGVDATLALVDALVARGVAGTFVSADLGVENAAGQRLVTGGRWELPLLCQVIDHALDALGAPRVTLVAASHGAAAAMRAAELHPLVDEVVLDSPLAVPLELLFAVAEARGRDRAAVRTELRAAELCDEAETFTLPARPGLRCLALRPVPDAITATCGFPAGSATVVEYPGPHAATMRHDSSTRGVPAPCLDAMHAFFAARPAP